MNSLSLAGTMTTLGMILVVACSSTDASDGSGGTAGTGGTTAPNTCPPSLLNPGGGPGIPCTGETGDTCSDTEQFCECGAETIEGRAWRCVPTTEPCPDAMPAEGASCDSGTGSACDYLKDGPRHTCRCAVGGWSCQVSDCGVIAPLNGAVCSDAGLRCGYFRAETSMSPMPAGNDVCTCGNDGYWSCVIPGCPAEFPGQGAACDENGPVNCSWRTPTDLQYCGCSGQWNCIVVNE